MKWLAILFTLFILLVIILADAGILAHYVGFIYEFPFGDKAGHFVLYGLLRYSSTWLFSALVPIKAGSGLPFNAAWSWHC